MFEYNEDAEIECIAQVGGKFNIIVIDDFYKNPDEVRDYANSLDPITKEQDPGLCAGVHKRRLRDDKYSQDMLDNVKPVFDELTSIDSLWTSPRVEIDYDHSWLGAEFVANKMRASDFAEGGVPHFDRLYQWGWVVYLNSVAEIEDTRSGYRASGGTGFYSYDGQMEFDDPLPHHEVEPGKWISAPLSGKFGKETASKWKLEHLVRMKYNRMVLYEGRMLHSQFWLPGQYENLDRLNQIFFM